MGDAAARALATSMAVGGIAHVASPDRSRRLAPPWVPARSAVVVLSGAADVAVGVLGVSGRRRSG
ncbi:hypothetical protein LY71_10578 [Geodermatophilus tzadiensis]|uniref:Uncharacterized protein n=1 Tax=Geodermatophilus tzadiensis TaxID=1137988 RepID=A0A2T0TVC6_9ACTN|nr:hypothetical protein [Geodermatophilus tzadiensis]PRY49634.1 hypothetical protein LY71_10578 [Geodermatophilus tzadiensis]